MKQLLTTLLLITTILCCRAQEQVCLSDFDYIIRRIKKDYPGYHDKVNEQNISDLVQLENDLREKIALHPDSCFRCLNRYTSWFKDHHLRVTYNYNHYSDSKKKTYEKKYAEFNLDSLQNNTKSIEGIWVGFAGSFAVKKEHEKYIGVSIDFSGYEAHQVMFEAVEMGNDAFELTTYRNFRGFKPQKEKASLFMDGAVLEIHDDTRFVRKTSDKKTDRAFITSYIPQYPNGLNTYPVAMNLIDSTFYIRVPGFNSNTSNDLVEKYWHEITSRPNLIIDIRNNGGGQDEYYEKLAELLYTDPYESRGVEWYATEGIIEDWENAIKNGEIKEGREEESKALVEEMKENIGGFVTHPFYSGDDTVRRDTVYSYPKQVGIIINGRNASSAEQFLLTAKHSSKVILFGNENTAGVLDYSNITPKELPSGKYNLWLPATRSKRLPENPIDNIGIAPDIIIPHEPEFQLYDRLDDWVYFVKSYLEHP